MLFRKLIFLIEVLFILLVISLPVYAEDDSGGGGVCCVAGVIMFFIAIVWVGAARQAAKRAREKAMQAAKEAREEARRTRERAEEAYKNCLERLKANPTKADLRQRTLELGRAYSNLARNSEGVTIFDEIALMNDLNAACAGATNITNTPPSPSPTPTSSLSIEDRLAKLSELKAKGLISEQEYDTKRKQILDEI